MHQEPLTSWSSEDDWNEEALRAAPDDPSGWLAEQCFVHGVLRAAHQHTEAANAARISSIMAAIDRPAASRHRWTKVAAAALVLCALAWPVLFVEHLPEARASVLRGARLLDDGDRRFSVEAIGVSDHGIGQNHQVFQLTARPGNRFVVIGSLDLGPIRFAAMRFGCDGQEVWFHSFGDSGELAEVKRAGPLEEAPSLLRGIGNVLDLGLLDVHRFVTEMPREFHLKTCGRIVDEDGQKLLHIEATGGPKRPGFHLQRADLNCCEQTGCIVRLEVQADDGLGRTQRLNFVDQGALAVDGSIYKRPW